MINILKKNKFFYIPYVFVLVFGILIVSIYTKADIHIFLNRFHSDFFDIFFKYITYFGDGILLPFFLSFLIFYKFRDALLFLLVFLLSGLIVQILKRFIFDDIVRPAEFFKGVYELYLVPGIHQLHKNSFPSGHSATVFGYMLCFAFIVKNQWVKTGMLLFAIIVAYSRIYLSQHFLIDTVVGSFIGVLTATILSYYVGISKLKWLDLNLISLKVKKKVPTC